MKEQQPVSPKGSTLIPLARIADLLNEYFSLTDDDTILYNTPYQWWQRSQLNNKISSPMPEETILIGRSPAWPQEQILHWWGEWMGIEVPRGTAAGDRIGKEGAYLKGSKYRVKVVVPRPLPKEERYEEMASAEMSREIDGTVKRPARRVSRGDAKRVKEWLEG